MSRHHEIETPLGQGKSWSIAVEGDPTFEDFSNTTRSKQHEKPLEKFGTARLPDPSSFEVTEAQRAYVEAVKRY